MTSVEVRRVLEQLLRDPCNQQCADCKNSAHPRWASWSLGVFVCIRCAGFHRSLGTHVSKVKSVDLDTWKEEHLQQVVRFGNNQQANKVFEGRLGGGSYVPDQSKMGQFIKTKYEVRKWYLEEGACEPALPEAAPAAASPLPVSVPMSPAGVGREASASPALAVSPAPASPPVYSANARPDLKKSILSLYAKPRQQSPGVASSASSLNSAAASAGVSYSAASLEDNELFKNVWT
ncbi:ADL084Wp [Eremothecium gossypii ATCC 10895]|uniref:ADL084Wp n=1 Tax=Eremothecium gossypii (strain ATCC 10895 / CBS 109.51 / FGSC 9923 / NRRL Y-1056) TaxID=284811 RepID=Q75AL1_EREGS|nr:ADL084Wp [Eremothecium gossypii ATCC 10895]AAS51836.1 ADL084Wp [Eremothecium gossypii ATCC 10895]AEY96133.1 FADL084Wp [Eremothecium gossypii FDAG1]